MTSIIVERVRELAPYFDFTVIEEQSMVKIVEDLMAGKPLLSWSAEASENGPVIRQVPFVDGSCNVSTSPSCVEAGHGEGGPVMPKGSVFWALFIACLDEAVLYKGENHKRRPMNILAGLDEILISDLTIDLKVLDVLINSHSLPQPSMFSHE